MISLKEKPIGITASEPGTPAGNCYTSISAGEKAMCFLCAEDPHSSRYNEGVLFRVPVQTDLARLRSAFTRLLYQYPVLQSTYSQVNGQFVRQIKPEAPVDWMLVNNTPLSRHQLDRSIQQYFNEPFDLATGPLFRVRLFLSGEDEWLVLASVHHIVCDGWSLNLLFPQLVAAWHYRDNQDPACLIASEPDYPLFIHRESEYLLSSDARQSLAFWRESLAAIPARVDLSPGHNPSTSQRQSIPFHLTGDNYREILAVAKSTNTTPFTVMMAAYQLLLARYCNRWETFIGIPWYNRPTRDMRSVVGYCVNTLPLYQMLDPSMSVVHHLQDLHRHLKQSISHGRFPFSLLNDEHRHANEGEPIPLQFYLSFRRGYEHSPVLGSNFLPEFDIKLIKQHSLFDIHLEIIEEKAGFACLFQYDPRRVAADLVAAAPGHFKQLLHLACTAPELLLSDLEFLSAEQRNELLTLAQGPVRDYLLDGGFPAAFRRSAFQYPDALAVADEHHQWTYQQLDQYSDQLARTLKQQWTIQPGQIVGVLLERSVLWAAALLAIGKTGAIYLPLDPIQPIDRLRFFVSDAG
ncbi:MAG TPA: condensation domain-containing protein, partial [Puia sp.]|uniref:condensation domain-containing protein n=1 Tax=Puia sp. TaxID=2045100 RepID=UPI002C65C379